MRLALFLAIAFGTVVSRADTNTVTADLAQFGTMVVSNLNNGLISARSNVVQSIADVPGVLRNDGKGPYWGPPMTAGLTNYATGNDFTLPNSYADVAFGSAIMQTPSLPTGTYLITALVQFYQNSGAHQQVAMKLVTAANAYVPGSERWVGPEPSNGDWQMIVQTLATVITNGQFKMQAYCNPGPAIRVRTACATISWIKIN